MLVRCAGLFGLFFVLTASFGNFFNNRWTFHWNGEKHYFGRLGQQAGSPYVDIKKIAEEFDLGLLFSKDKSNALLREPKSGRQVSIKSDSPLVRSFWGENRLSVSVKKFPETLGVPLDFGDRVLRPLLLGKSPAKIYEHFKNIDQVDVVIDPGHGGNDWGAHLEKGGVLYKEKELTLKVARYLKADLARYGIRSVLTREKDLYLSLPERTWVANQLKAKVFLSLHFNASVSPTVRGFEVYALSLKKEDHQSLSAVARENQLIPSQVMSEAGQTLARMRAEVNLENSLKLAKPIVEALKNVGPFHGKNVKAAPFYVLFGTRMPALLLELGFIHSDEDMLWMRSPENLRKSFGHLSAAIVSYLNGVPPPKIKSDVAIEFRKKQ